MSCDFRLDDEDCVLLYRLLRAASDRDPRYAGLLRRLERLAFGKLSIEDAEQSDGEN